jgi:hypothetical protein
MPLDGRSVLVLESTGGIRLLDVRKFLGQIEDTYNRVLLLLTLLDAMPRLGRSQGSLFFPLAEMTLAARGAIAARGEGRLVHFTKSSVASVVGKSQLLILRSVRLESPGSWKLLGVSDSFEVLRKYLNDRHERRKDKKYREATDEEKRHLENELLRTRVLSERIKTAKELGATEEDLAPLLGQLLYDPLDELAVFQDRGLIEDVKIVGPDEPDEPQPEIPLVDLHPKRRIDLE